MQIISHGYIMTISADNAIQLEIKFNHTDKSCIWNFIGDALYKNIDICIEPNQYLFLRNLAKINNIEFDESY